MADTDDTPAPDLALSRSQKEQVKDPTSAFRHQSSWTYFKDDFDFDEKGNLFSKLGNRAHEINPSLNALGKDGLPLNTRQHKENYATDLVALEQDNTMSYDQVSVAKWLDNSIANVAPNFDGGANLKSPGDNPNEWRNWEINEPPQWYARAQSHNPGYLEGHDRRFNKLFNSPRKNYNPYSKDATFKGKEDRALFKSLYYKMYLHGLLSKRQEGSSANTKLSTSATAGGKLQHNDPVQFVIWNGNNGVSTAGVEVRQTQLNHSDTSERYNITMRGWNTYKDLQAQALELGADTPEGKEASQQAGDALNAYRIQRHELDQRLKEHQKGVTPSGKVNATASEWISDTTVALKIMEKGQLTGADSVQLFRELERKYGSGWILPNLHKLSPVDGEMKRKFSFIYSIYQGISEEDKYGRTHMDANTANRFAAVAGLFLKPNKLIKTLLANDTSTKDAIKLQIMRSHAVTYFEAQQNSMDIFTNSGSVPVNDIPDLIQNYLGNTIMMQRVRAQANKDDDRTTDTDFVSSALRNLVDLISPNMSIGRYADGTAYAIPTTDIAIQTFGRRFGNGQQVPDKIKQDVVDSIQWFNNEIIPFNSDVQWGKNIEGAARHTSAELEIGSVVIKQLAQMAIGVHQGRGSMSKADMIDSVINSGTVWGKPTKMVYGEVSEAMKADMVARAGPDEHMIRVTLLNVMDERGGNHPSASAYYIFPRKMFKGGGRIEGFRPNSVDLAGKRISEHKWSDSGGGPFATDSLGGFNANIKEVIERVYSDDDFRRTIIQYSTLGWKHVASDQTGRKGASFMHPREDEAHAKNIMSQIKALETIKKGYGPQDIDKLNDVVNSIRTLENQLNRPQTDGFMKRIPKAKLRHFGYTNNFHVVVDPHTVRDSGNLWWSKPDDHSDVDINYMKNVYLHSTNEISNTLDLSEKEAIRKRGNSHLTNHIEVAGRGLYDPEENHGPDNIEGTNMYSAYLAFKWANSAIKASSRGLGIPFLRRSLDPPAENYEGIFFGDKQKKDRGAIDFPSINK